VSHQLERIVEFADDALLLADGSVARTGRPEDCVQAYIDGDHPMTAEAATSPFTIEGLSLAGDGPVRAGAEVGVTIEARATGLGAPDTASVGLRVRAVPEEPCSVRDQLLGLWHRPARRAVSRWAPNFA